MLISTSTNHGHSFTEDFKPLMQALKVKTKQERGRLHHSIRTIREIVSWSMPEFEGEEGDAIFDSYLTRAREYNFVKITQDLSGRISSTLEEE